MSLTVTWAKSFERMRQQIGFDVLVQPEVNDARDTIVKRIERGGRKMGAKRNTLTASTRPLGATVVTTLSNPRQSGKAWGKYNTLVVVKMGPHVLRKMVKRIRERFAAEVSG